MVRILKEVSFRKDYQKYFLIFFLLNWDVLVWSSLANFKDMFVLALTTSALFYLVKVLKKPTIVSLAALGFIWFLFGFIRLYIPLLMLGSALLFLGLHGTRRHQIIIFLLVTLLAYYANRLLDIFAMIDPGQFVRGFMHMLLTPRPWAVDPNYSFLKIPAILHWIFIAPALVMAVQVWRAHSYARVLLLFSGIVVCAYAAFTELEGPRHRLQILPVLCWLQFHFVWWLLPKAQVLLLKVAPENSWKPA